MSFLIGLSLAASIHVWRNSWMTLLILWRRRKRVNHLETSLLSFTPAFGRGALNMYAPAGNLEMCSTNGSRIRLIIGSAWAFFIFVNSAGTWMHPAKSYHSFTAATGSPRRVPVVSAIRNTQADHERGSSAWRAHNSSSWDHDFRPLETG